MVTASPSYDAVAVVLGSSALREPETVGAPLRDCASSSDKPVVGFVSPDAPQLVRTLNLAGVPTFTAPESCAATLAALRRAAEMTKIKFPSEPFVAVVRDDLTSLLRPGALNEAESKRLFARFGIPITREVVAKTPEVAEAAAKTFTGNVVIKALSRDVLHKSEAGGVAVNIAPENVARICAQIAERFYSATRHKPEGFLVQELVSDGVEMILGFHHDAQLGPVILLGMGGLAAELYRDMTLRLVPVSRSVAKEMVDELKTSAILKGFRGRPITDIDALVDAILAFSNMLVAIGNKLQEAEINPLFVLPRGQGVVAADGLVLVKANPNEAAESASEEASP